MEARLPPLEDVLGKLPWFDDLSSRHRNQLLGEVADHLGTSATRAQYASLLEQWADIAHSDVKWSRYELLRESGLLAS